MPSAKKNKISNLLKPKSFNVLVCQDNNFKPHIESFFHSPENLTQKKMGFLFGVLEITDHSEDSSYIVNFLISTIKKEFYKNTKRGAIESLESALHKANLVLSKLAQHENIGWINNIHAVVGIFEKNNLYISSAGKGVATIIRKNNLINLTKQSENKKNNPLKTFEDIVSGKIDEEDKLIISTPELFDIFSSQEIKKSSQRFNQEKFIQFLKTALSNELDKIALLVIYFEKNKKTKNKKVTKNVSEGISNVFSQRAFKSKKKPVKSNSQESKTQKKPTKKKAPSNHLYIKEGLEIHSDNESNIFNSKLKQIPNFFSEIEIKNSLKIPWRGIIKKTKNLFSKSNFFKLNRWVKEEIKNFISFLQKYFVNIKKKIKQIKTKKSTTQKTNTNKIKRIYFNFEKTSLAISSPLEKVSLFFKKLSLNKKIYLLILILLVILFPLLFLKKNKREISTTPVEKISNESNPSTKEDLSKQQLFEYLPNYSNKENNQTIVNLKNNIFAIGDNYLFNFKDQEVIKIPSEFGKIVSTTTMKDLNLIFLFNQKKEILSFAPTSKKFQSNIIELPKENQLEIVGTYMTYLYFINKDTNEIYRYPRSDGGFGEKFNWLKDSADLKNISQSAINENIFLASENDITKFFKGKKQSFSISKNITPHSIFTQYDWENLYILDKKNKKVLLINNNGATIQEFENDIFHQAKEIAADQENKIIYLLLENGDVIKFKF